MDDGGPEATALEILSRCLDLPEDQCKAARLRGTPSWDSFAHVEIVVEVEERYSVHLTTEQIEGLNDFDTLVELLHSIQGAR